MSERKFMVVLDNGEDLEFPVEDMWDLEWGADALAIKTATQDLIVRKSHIIYTVQDIDDIEAAIRRDSDAIQTIRI